MQDSLSLRSHELPQEGEDHQGRLNVLEDLEARRSQAEDICHRMSVFRSNTLAIGLPLLLLALVVLVPFAPETIKFYCPWLHLHPVSAIGVSWALLALAASAYFYFAVFVRARNARRQLLHLEDLLQRRRLAHPKDRLQFLKDRLALLTNLSAKVFIEDGERYDQASKWRQNAGKALGRSDVEILGDEPSLSELQFCLDSLNELILREQREQREQRNWQLLAMLIMTIYIGGLYVSAAFSGQRATDLVLPIFGVPLSIVMWGGAGSLAAILYRFYTEKDRIRFASEVRWLVARPMIGIIMSAVVYIALVSGLILLGAPPANANEASSATLPSGRLEVYWVIAFLAGFSDKFYLGVINLLVKRSLPESGARDLERRGSDREAEES